MNPRLVVILPVVLTAAFAGWGVVQGQPWLMAPAALAVVAAIAVIAGLRPVISTGTRTVALVADPRLLDLKRKSITEELAVLEDAQELQRGVFEVSAELVGCVDEVDARHRFAAAM